MKRYLAAAISGAVLLSGVVASVALAHENDELTGTAKLTMDYKPIKEKFAGDLTSTRNGCVGGRKVKLFKASNNLKVGSTETKPDGTWAIAAKPNSGKYYAKVVPIEIVLGSGSDEYGELWEHVLNCVGDRTDAKPSS